MPCSLISLGVYFLMEPRYDTKGRGQSQLGAWTTDDACQGHRGADGGALCQVGDSGIGCQNSDAMEARIAQGGEESLTNVVEEVAGKMSLTFKAFAEQNKDVWTQK